MTKSTRKAKKAKLSSNRRPPLTSKVINMLQKANKRKVIDIQEIRNAKIKAEELDASIIKKEKMDQLDPLHAAYTYAQNKMSVIIEQLSELPALSKLVSLYEAAQDEYIPKGPPISPLSLSYFTCWGFFDLNIGIQKESLGFIAAESCKQLQADPGLIKLFEIMNASRMGLYVHEGFSEKFVFLREFVTGNKLKAKVISGYDGQPGEIWLARLFPPPFQVNGLDYSIVFITPYVIGKVVGDRFYFVGDEQGWLEYLDRTLNKVQAKDRVEAYEKLMKYGLSRHYWNEYIFEAYVNYTQESIILTGFPDIPLSRPNSKENNV